MGQITTIKQANALTRSEIFIALSDGRVLLVTLEQVFNLSSQVLPDNEEDRKVIVPGDA